MNAKKATIFFYNIILSNLLFNPFFVLEYSLTRLIISILIEWNGRIMSSLILSGSIGRKVNDT